MIATPITQPPTTFEVMNATVASPLHDNVNAPAAADPVAQALDTAAKGQPHMLRVLVVDDNALNLAVLTRLLRKRFSHMLDGAPVAVDSALKALQLLRENVFDVILMDIQMPFLSGVDCTERIRAGVEGVLDTNRYATIIAVTTATGVEPEELYRRSGFDGIIGKPVKFEVMQEFLTPLHRVASDASHQIAPISLDGQLVTPAIPVMPLIGERIFFVPSVHRNSPHAPSITLSADFETLLKQQTRTSLRRFGAYAISRTGTLPGSSDRRRLRQYDNGDDDSSSQGSSGASSPPASSTTDESITTDDPSLGTRDLSSRLKRGSSIDRPFLHRRQASLTISQSHLQYQLQQEMKAAELNGESDGQDDVSTTTAQRPLFRMLMSHRHSTPDVTHLDDLARSMDAQHLTVPPSEEGTSSDSAREDSSDGFDTLSPLASPNRLHALMPSPLGDRVSRQARPGVRPYQPPITPDRRRSSADQSTTSQSTSDGSEVSSSSGHNSSRFGFSSSSNDCSKSSIKEGVEEFDSPLTSPETEDPPLFGQDDEGQDVQYWPCAYTQQFSVGLDDCATRQGGDTVKRPDWHAPSTADDTLTHSA